MHEKGGDLWLLDKKTERIYFPPKLHRMTKLDVESSASGVVGEEALMVGELDDELTSPNQVFTVLPRGTRAIGEFGSERPRGRWRGNEG